MKAARSIFFSWLPIAVAVTGLCLLVSITVQQNYRQSLNDPQIQMAEDLAAKLDVAMADPSGKMLMALENTIAADHVDIQQSLSPWLGVYGLGEEADTGVIATGALLNGDAPLPPSGALLAAQNDRGKGANRPFENRVTWETHDGDRQAIVIVYAPGAHMFAIAGRNMREVEYREGQLSAIALLAWVCIMGATLAVQAFIPRLR